MNRKRVRPLTLRATATLLTILAMAVGCSPWNMSALANDWIWSEDFSDFGSDRYYWDNSGCSYVDSEEETLVLTTDSAYCRTRFYLKSPYHMGQFEAEFDFKTGQGALSGGDGLTFAFVRAYNYPAPGSNPVANSGKWLDFEAASGYAVEFDTYHNYESDPGPPNHVALIQDSVANHLVFAEIPGIEDSVWHHVLIRFANGRVVVYLDGSLVIDYTIVDFTSFTGFFGFTAATGGHANFHIVDNVKVRRSFASATNNTPISIAGDDQYIELGKKVVLDGKSSYDPDGSPLTYCWEQVAGPPVELSSATGQEPHFVPKISGIQYEFELVVSDGFFDSEADTVTVSVFPDMIWPLYGSKEDHLNPQFYKFDSSWQHRKCGGAWKKHVGVDLDVAHGQPVRAVAGGVVVDSSDHRIVVEHLGFLSTPRLDFTTLYLHVVPEVLAGEVVVRGQRIATIQATNIDHLHFGIRLGTYASSRREYDGIVTYVAHRGALPIKHGDSDFDGEDLTGCRSDPLFPGQFIDPFLLDY